MNATNTGQTQESYNVAVVGMAGRFPGASNIGQFWKNLRGGVETIKFFTDEELSRAGVPQAWLQDPGFVKAYPVLEGMELFDAGFFGLSPRDASIMDPQHRQFLECAWEALEHGGCDPETYPGAIGVFAGSGRVSYLTYHLLPNRHLMESVGEFLLRHTGNDKDFLATRVSYEFDLKGPSLNVQTACSTSLVAIHLACQSLLMGECDVALAGGVTILLPQDQGYLYREGEVLSPDGHCRAFDAKAKGTVFGNGVGVVVLKRLEDAWCDGDSIMAIIRGSAVNNDGSMKGGYLAPSVDGQAKVVAAALATAGVDAESISYVEMHGTGTSVGDPIEVAALAQAFRNTTEKNQFCGIGSVKTNIGHVDTAAGVASFMKTVLSLQYCQIPANLHFEAPNPEIDFANSPFYVNDKLTEWRGDRAPRRAGVNSLGIGGTNVHVILEEAPEMLASGASRPWQALMLSAKTASALEAAAKNLCAHLEEHPGVNLADVAFTLQAGRKRFKHRRVIICATTEGAVNALKLSDSKNILTRTDERKDRAIAFMFTGQGSQYVNMGRELYGLEPVFREAVDQCSELLRVNLGLDLRTILFPETDKAEGAGLQMHETAITQPALFVVEYALATLWKSWGLQPEAMIGHSIGEYVAACLAGVFSLEEALRLVAARGRLMQQQPGGAMIALPVSEEELRPYLSKGVSVAAINGPGLCVISGSYESIASVEKQLANQDIAFQRLRTSHAFHSAMMEPILRPFEKELRRVKLQPPQIPFISNVTGDWITDAEATDPAYWMRHARQTVRFAEGLKRLLEESHRLLVEVGPGRTLSRLAIQHPAKNTEQVVLRSLRHPEEEGSDSGFLLRSVAGAWLAGAKVEWTGFYAHERRRRIPLPTYPFEHQRYWIERGEHSMMDDGHASRRSKKSKLADWFYQPSWKRSPVPLMGVTEREKKLCWLIFEDEKGLGSKMRKRLEAQPETLGGLVAEQARASNVVMVRKGSQFLNLGDHLFIIDPERAGDYWRLLRELAGTNCLPDRILHLWNIGADGTGSVQASFNRRTALFSYHSLIFLAQAISEVGWTHPIQLGIASEGMQALAGEAVLQPIKALLLGPCKVIPREFPNIQCRSIDIEIPEGGTWQEQRLIDQLEVEFEAPPGEQVVAYRGGARWIQVYEPLPLELATAVDEKLPHSSSPGAVDAGHELTSEISVRERKTSGRSLSRPANSQSSGTPAAVLPISGTPEQGFTWDGEDRSIRAGGVYIITGGLGGLGLEVARYLADKARVKLVLAGRTGLPRREDWETILSSTDPAYKVHRAIRAVQSFEAKGSEVMIVAADVSKREELQALLEGVQQRFGVIHGIIHGAGVLDDGLIQLKTVEGAERVLTPKVAGALLLDELLAQTKLDFLILFSSLSALAGVPGQVDYCAANSFLDAFAQWKAAKDGTRTVTINWGAWQEVGMAAELATQPLVLVQEHTNGATAHPVRIDRVADLGTEKHFSNELSLAQFWVLSEHKFQGGEAVIPGTTYLEMARAASQAAGMEAPLELRDVLFILPLEVRPKESKPVRLRLKPGKGAAEFVIESQQGTQWQEHARGTTAQIASGAAQRISLSEITARCNRLEKIFTGPRPETREDRYFFLGPRWNSLKQINFGASEALASLELPREFLTDLDSFKLHPALLDWATSFALHLINDYEASELMYIPFSYKRLRMYGALPRHIYSYARCPEPSNHEFPTFHLTITDPEGVVLVEVEEFTMKGIKPAARGKTNGRPVGNVRRPAFDLQFGIAPKEGREVLDRILSRPGLAQVIVSPQDLLAWMEGLDNSSEPSEMDEKEATNRSLAAARLSRSNLTAPYVAPRDELENSLTKVWEEALGMEGIGIEDNFFELGGHSLLLTQTITRMRKLLPAEISVRKLFARPTIAAIVAEAAAMPMVDSTERVPTLAAVPRESMEIDRVRQKGPPKLPPADSRSRPNSI